MLNYCLLFFSLIVTFYLLATAATTTATDSQSLQSPPQSFDSQFDIQHSTSLLDQIQVPAYVSTSYTNNLDKKNPTSTNHSITSAISASVQLCKKIGGEKGAATCSYLLIDRPWRQWRQRLSQSFNSAKTRYGPIIYNCMVRKLGHPSIDGLHALQIKVHDWWNFPGLEWHLFKSRLIGLWDQYHGCYLSWRLGKKDWWLSYYSKYYGDGKLEPDQDGCYYDVLGTTLCVDEQRLLDDNGLNDRVNELFEAMTYEERSYTLRFQQRFIQWATKASIMTAESMDRAQSLWLQHTQAIYRFLDDALSLDPCTNSNNVSSSSSSKQDNHDQRPTTNPMNLCPPVVFPFSTSPFDTSLEPTFFSLGSQPQSLRPTTTTATPPTRSYSSLIPIRQPWTACLANQNDNTGEKNNDYDDSGIPERKSIHLSQQLLDPYNKMQYQYLVTRLQKEMMKQLERLEKATLQEYYRAMVTAPQQWTTRHDDRHQQQQHRPQPQKLHVYKAGYAAQQLYQELRLYISISSQQLYKQSIQQLMDAAKQYDELVMEQVEHAYDDSEWIKKLQARRLYTFYPLQDDTPNTNHHTKEPETNSLRSSSPYPVDSVIKTRAVTFIGQRADWAIQTHRKTVLHQWKGIFENLDRQSHSIWVSAMDQAQGRHRVWTSCNATCTFFMDLVKLLTVLIFLLFM